MPCPHLPIELFTEISAHMPRGEILNLALANKQLYDLSIGKFYRHIDITSVHEASLALNCQKSSMGCIRALVADEQKRRGVESIRFLGIGINANENEDIVIPEPYSSVMKAMLDEWKSAQPILIELVNSLLTADFDFPRLRTVLYDADALLTEQGAERFLSFLRRHPAIRNVIIEGDNMSLFHKWTFSRIPEHLVCRFPDLERAIIYGPLLPLLLGFTFSPDKSASSGEFGPLIRHHTMPDTLPLVRVHIWWPQQLAPVITHPNKNSKDSTDQVSTDLDILDVTKALSSLSVAHPVNNSNHTTDPVSVDLDVLHVMKALSSLCESSLEVLSVWVDDEWIDETLIDLISTHFPNLRELYLGPACSDPMARLPNHNFMRRVAEKISRLRHLTHFMYRYVGEQSDQCYQFADTLELNEDWRDTARYFSDCCPSIEHIRLYSLTWGIAIPPLRATRWG